MKLTDYERELWNDFLDQLQTHIDNAGCNNFKLANTVEGRRIAEDMIKTQYGQKDQKQLLEDLEDQIEYGGEIGVLDTSVFVYLRDKVDQILDESNTDIIVTPPWLK